MRRKTLRVLTLAELELAEREAAAMAGDADTALCACVVARALGRPGGRRILRRCAAEELIALTEDYLARCREAADVDAAMARLSASPAARLRWVILRTFHVLPTEARALALTPEDLRDCAAHLLLDAQEHGGEGAVNPAFDEAAFARAGAVG